MKKIFILMMLFSSALFSSDKNIDVVITDITDSDTFTIGADAWHVSLQNVDIPSAAYPHCEEERQAGLMVIELLKTKLLPKAKSIAVTDVDFTNMFTVTPVNMQVDGKDLAQMLIDKGLARRYTWNYAGWCD